ncbi:hypothetical protein MQE36_15505 [Zhouia spongiae]|uniref:Uncharacterized protein n=1 Tax=Zhouia spongiae TaxID=2202721 RepID=A0ABY3YKX3_9FLAO|nr:DUF6660 family protein [Zhouia spongiae]UNY98472.1 hypothetical protein MQE36_15505 [Zhouia spongiae]
MKSIAFILSLFLIGLSLAPCSDAEVKAECEMQVTADHNDHEQHIDLCSPFCVCQCCHSHTTFPTQLFEVKNTHTVIVSVTNNYLSLVTDSHLEKLLRPPQI